MLKGWKKVACPKENLEFWFMRKRYVGKRIESWIREGRF